MVETKLSIQYIKNNLKQLKEIVVLGKGPYMKYVGRGPGGFLWATKHFCMFYFHNFIFYVKGVEAQNIQISY